MTVIATAITKHCCAHGSDSLITELQKDGSFEPVEWTRSKIVSVRHWRGAMAYWGLAKYEAYKWSTFDWLQEQVAKSNQYLSAEEFARNLKDGLNQKLAGMKFVNPLHAGIGIHLTAYEVNEGYRIPELFLISNFANPLYNSLHTDGVRLSRETYHTINHCPPKDEHREGHFRLKVHEYLQQPGRYVYFQQW